jgi:imidazolonepropionase-like amidohydrolase
VPALIDVYAHQDEAAIFQPGHPATADAARAQIAQAAARKLSAIHIWRMEPPVAEAALEAARESGIAAIGHISTEAEVRYFVDRGATGFVGMIADTEDLDSTLVARLRDLRIFFAPALATAGPQLPVTLRNTRRLFSTGVPIAVASNGSTLQAEIDLLVEAGVPPLDAIVAATRNGAAALHQLDKVGTIQAGKRSDLLLLSANPGADIRNLTRVALRIDAGKWR